MAVVISPAPGLFRRRSHNASITFAHALGIICQDGLVCVEPRRAPGALRAINGIGRGLEILAGMPDIDQPDVW